MQPQFDQDQLLSIHKMLERYARAEEKERCEENLFEFVQTSWPFLVSTPFQSTWALEAMCDHLEAVTLGHVPRLLINIPPRCSKTSICSEIFPAWTWARGDTSFWSGPQVRFLCASYGHTLSLMSANRSRRLILSPWYQQHWGDRVVFRADQNTKGQYETTAGGSRQATSVGGGLLGLGGDILIADDLNNTEQVESEAERENVKTFWSEFSSTRLNDPRRSAIIVVQQRLHELDNSGLILDSGDDWVHLCIPMRYDASRSYHTIKLPQYEGEDVWDDPRTEEGELMWPERFDEKAVQRLERELGPYMAAGRLQQLPVPKGGGILQSAWWQLWDAEAARAYGREWHDGRKEFPDFELVVASLDTAYGEKEENDFSALTVWGIFIDKNKNRRAMLAYAWDVRKPLHGKVTEALPNEPKPVFEARKKENMGLVELVADTCRRYGVRRLLIEDKTRGRDVAQEISRLYARENYGVELINPVRDKVSRAHSVVPMFTDNGVWAPNTRWADKVISQCASFPKGTHDDLVDSVTQFFNWARENGILIRADEAAFALEDEMQYRPPVQSVAAHYGV